MSDPSLLLPPSVVQSIAEDIAGPILISSLLSVWLYGILVMQMHHYFTEGEKGPRWVQGYVYGVGVLATACAAQCMLVTYQYCVLDFGLLLELGQIRPTLSALTFTTFTTGSVTQLFFGWRLKRLTGATWKFLLLLALNLSELSCAIATVVFGSIEVTFTKFFQYRGFVIAWLVLVSITDSYLALALVHYLRSKRTGFKNTDDLISRLSRLSIQTGAVTAVSAIFGTILFLTKGSTNLYLIFSIPLAPMYANCLLSALNARTYGDFSKTSQNSNPKVNQRFSLQVRVQQPSHQVQSARSMSAYDDSIPNSARITSAADFLPDLENEEGVQDYGMKPYGLDQPVQVYSIDRSPPSAQGWKPEAPRMGGVAVERHVEIWDHGDETPNPRAI